MTGGSAGARGNSLTGGSAGVEGDSVTGGSASSAKVAARQPRNYMLDLPIGAALPLNGGSALQPAGGVMILKTALMIIHVADCVHECWWANFLLRGTCSWTGSSTFSMCLTRITRLTSPSSRWVARLNGSAPTRERADTAPRVEHISRRTSRASDGLEISRSSRCKRRQCCAAGD